MKLSDFNYELPEELIAQYPCERRDGSRLLVVKRFSEELEHRNFYDIAEYISPSDCLVVNDTKVMKARLIAKRQDTGARAEVLFLERLNERLFKCLIDTSTKVRVGTRFVFSEGAFTGDVRAEGNGMRIIELNIKEGRFNEMLDRFGSVPLPPYIRRSPQELDETRYQTVYATAPGAIAAPTAGLHFTEGILDRIRAKGASIAPITLHVGYGTFRPVTSEEVSRHRLEPEYFEVKEEVAAALNDVKERGGKIFAVGTTTCRALEFRARFVKGSRNRIEKGRGWVDLFIYPPYNFKFVDALLTNFHLPRTTLLMLTAAFCGKELLLRAYDEAIREQYRFYSYGDAILIV